MYGLEKLVRGKARSQWRGQEWVISALRSSFIPWIQVLALFSYPVAQRISKMGRRQGSFHSQNCQKNKRKKNKLSGDII